MKLEEQLKMWRVGISMHNLETDECCPDFSCCKPWCKASDDDRRKYCAAYAAGETAVVNTMLGQFLRRAYPQLSIDVLGV